MGDVETRFSDSYETARARFREATRTLPNGSLPVVDGYTIDWAWLGNPVAADVLVITSGLHGVEGYAGSAAQLEMLGAPDPTPTLYLHALNPWGMGNLRRVNENNVDLNRNFLPPNENWTGADAGYALLDGTLNPPSAPAFDCFLARVGWLTLRYGYGKLKNALMSGQHSHPKGLQYAGAQLEVGPGRLLHFLDDALAGKRRVVHVDLHCGRGKYGTYTPLLDGGNTSEQAIRVRDAFGPGVKAWEPDDPLAYTIRGGLTAEMQRRYSSARVDALTVEFGTYADLRLLQAFRDENRAHHWSGGALDHPAKLALLEGFCPGDPAWRAGVLRHAIDIRQRASVLLAHD